MPELLGRETKPFLFPQGKKSCFLQGLSILNDLGSSSIHLLEVVVMTARGEQLCRVDTTLINGSLAEDPNPLIPAHHPDCPQKPHTGTAIRPSQLDDRN
jgi:hypothetical protein